MRLKSLLILVSCFVVFNINDTQAQELNFKVTVDKIPALSLVKADPQFLSDLARRIEEFFNNTQ